MLKRKNQNTGENSRMYTPKTGDKKNAISVSYTTENIIGNTFKGT